MDASHEAPEKARLPQEASKKAMGIVTPEALSEKAVGIKIISGKAADDTTPEALKVSQSQDVYTTESNSQMDLTPSMEMMVSLVPGKGH